MDGEFKHSTPALKFLQSGIFPLPLSRSSSQTSMHLNHQIVSVRTSCRQAMSLERLIMWQTSGHITFLFNRVFPKIDTSGHIGNKGLCREEQNKFSTKCYGDWTWDPRTPLVAHFVTFLLNLDLFCSVLRTPLLRTLPESSVLGETRIL